MENEKLQEQTESMADYEAHFDDANPWNVVARYQEEGTNLHVKVEGIVNGGVIAMVEGLRGFIPASRLSLSYIEDLETYLLKEIDVRVIEANQAEGQPRRVSGRRLCFEVGIPAERSVSPTRAGALSLCL